MLGRWDNTNGGSTRECAVWDTLANRPLAEFAISNGQPASVLSEPEFDKRASALMSSEQRCSAVARWLDVDAPSNASLERTSLMAAIGKSLEFGAKIPIGCLYKVDKPIYDDSEPVLQKGPLVDQPLGLSRETFNEILAETM